MVQGKTPVKAAQAGFTSQVKSSPAGLRGAITAANRAGQGQMSVETEKMTKAPTMTKAPQADLDRKAASETTPKSSTVIETPVQPSVDPFAGLTGGARQAEIERQAGLTPTMALEPEVEQPLTLQAERTQPAQLEAPSLAAQRQALQERLLASMTPDAEEQALQDELAQLRGSVAMGVAGEEGQGRLRTQNIVRGRQAIQQRQGALQEQTLLDRLAAKQAQRSAELGRLQTELGIITGEEQAQAQAQQAMAEQLKPFEFAGNLVQFDPATGQLITVAEAPAEVAKPITVSAGQTVLDPNTGEVLFQAPDKPEQLPTSIQEYLFAAQQGFTGSFSDFQNQGQAQGKKALSSEASKTLSNVQSGIRSLETLRQAIDSDQRGGRPLYASGSYKAAEDNLVDIIGRLRSGGAITSDEEDRFRDLLPKRFNTYKTANFKLNQLEALLNDALEGISPGSQADNDPLGIFGGEGDDPLGLGFNNDLSRSQNGSPNLLKLGQVTGYGSPLWKHGLDIDLKKGDPVPAPVSGTVEFVGERGGFGNQVRIRDANGNSHWLSHLDVANVRPGQLITAGQIVGKGGNTGRTIPGKGGDGSHLDYTVVDSRGGYIPPKQIAQFLNQIG